MNTPVLYLISLEIHFIKSKLHFTKVEDKIHEKVFNFNWEHDINLIKLKLYKFEIYKIEVCLYMKNYFNNNFYKFIL